MVIRKSDKFLLDSDISIWITRQNNRVADAVLWVMGRKTAAISVMTVAEIYKGWRSSEEKTYQDFFAIHTTISPDLAIAEVAGKYWQEYKRFNPNIVDYLIAASCRVYKLTLLTTNTKHFPMKDIKVINPLS